MLPGYTNLGLITYIRANHRVFTKAGSLITKNFDNKSNARAIIKSHRKKRKKTLSKEHMNLNELKIT